VDWVRGHREKLVDQARREIFLQWTPKMLEQAREVTRNGKYTYIEYARFADDLVILIDAYPRHEWLLA
jgi:RNA-directed DNA polymerase